MFTYAYNVPAYTATLTSSGTTTSTFTFSTVEANTSTTYEELLLTTGTYNSTYTETQTTTYTIGDYYSASTSTCDYSSGASSQSNSGATTSDPFSSTSTYATTQHGTNGTHSITTRSVVEAQVLDFQSSTTQACTYTFFDIATFSGSTDYTNYTSYTYQTITHDVLGTHTVSYRTLEVTDSVDASGSFTGNCDYFASSTESQSFSSDYGAYTIISYYTTTHDIYGMGVHTVNGSTSEISSSIATVTLSSTKVSETTSTIVVNVYGNLRTTSYSETSHSSYYSLSQLDVSFSPEQSITAVAFYGYSNTTNVTISDVADSYAWGSYYLTGTDGGTSVGYSKGVYGNTFTMASTSTYGFALSANTLKSTGVSNTTIQTSSFSSSRVSFFYNSGSETEAIVSLGNLTYVTSSVSSSGSYTDSSNGFSVTSTSSSTTTVTSFSYVNYVTYTISTAGPIVASRTTAGSTKTYSHIVGTTNTGGDPTTTTAALVATAVTTQTTSSTQKSYDIAGFTLSSSASQYQHIRYLALNGELLYIPTLTTSGTWRLESVGYTATSWQNEPQTAAYISAGSSSNSTFTAQSAATLIDISSNRRYVIDQPSLSMDPEYILTYKSIETPMSAVDSMMFLGNNDYALFGLQAYNKTDSSAFQEVSYGAGGFDQTVNGTTNSIDYATVGSSVATVEAKRFHPRITIASTTQSASPASFLFNFSTSDTVTRV